jgi:hypothetical protein
MERMIATPASSGEILQLVGVLLSGSAQQHGLPETRAEGTLCDYAR